MGQSRRKRKRERERLASEATACESGSRGGGGNVSSAAMTSVHDVRMVGRLANYASWEIPKKAFAEIPAELHRLAVHAEKPRLRISAARVLGQLHGQNVSAATRVESITLTRQQHELEQAVIDAAEPLEETTSPESSCREWLSECAYLEDASEAELLATLKELNAAGLIDNKQPNSDPETLS